MLVSGREAREVLEAHGISPWRARRALELGLAGEPAVARAARLYDAEAVRELASRRAVQPLQMRTVAPQGYVVSQLNLDAQLPRDVLLAAAASAPRRMPSLAAALMLIGADGRLPLIATIAGFVVARADFVGWRDDAVQLENPGPWADELFRTQLPTGKGRGWTAQDPSMWAAYERSGRREPAVGN